MTRTVWRLAFFLSASAAACARLPETRSRVTGAFALDTLPDAASIPASWGTLVSVTINPSSTDVTHLWFQDSAGSIHMVVYDSQKHEFDRVATLITRR